MLLKKFLNMVNFHTQDIIGTDKRKMADVLMELKGVCRKEFGRSSTLESLRCKSSLSSWDHLRCNLAKGVRLFSFWRNRKMVVMLVEDHELMSYG
jgi:hypothetical protein